MRGHPEPATTIRYGCAPGTACFACDDEGGHRSDTHAPRGGVAVHDLAVVFVGGQQAQHHAGIHAAGVCDVGQHIMIANIAPFDKVGLKQRVHDFGLVFFDPGPMDQTVCV